MNSAIIALAVFVLYLLAYKTYGCFLSEMQTFYSQDKFMLFSMALTIEPISKLPVAAWHSRQKSLLPRGLGRIYPIWHEDSAYARA